MVIISGCTLVMRKEKKTDGAVFNQVMNDRGKPLNVIEYKSYRGSAEVSVTDGGLYGQVLGIRGAVAYEGNTLQELEEDFHVMLDDYLEDEAKKTRVCTKGLGIIGTGNIDWFCSDAFLDEIQGLLTREEMKKIECGEASYSDFLKETHKDVKDFDDNGEVLDMIMLTVQRR